MRETKLARGEARRVVRTDDAGTTVLDGEGAVVAQHGNDRHDWLLDTHAAEGWSILADGNRAPAAAGNAPDR